MEGQCGGFAAAAGQPYAPDLPVDGRM